MVSVKGMRSSNQGMRLQELWKCFNVANASMLQILNFAYILYVIPLPVEVLLPQASSVDKMRRSTWSVAVSIMRQNLQIIAPRQCPTEAIHT